MNNALILNLSFIPQTKSLKKTKMISKIFWALSLISIILLIVLYIFQVNSLTHQNYLFKKQENKLAELKKEKEDLEINFSQANSLANIENYFQNESFEKAEKVKYIQILGSAVAGLSNKE